MDRDVPRRYLKNNLLATDGCCWRPRQLSNIKPNYLIYFEFFSGFIHGYPQEYPRKFLSHYIIGQGLTVELAGEWSSNSLVTECSRLALAC